MAIINRFLYIYRHLIVAYIHTYRKKYILHTPPLLLSFRNRTPLSPRPRKPGLTSRTRFVFLSSPASAALHIKPTRSLHCPRTHFLTIQLPPSPR